MHLVYIIFVRLKYQNIHGDQAHWAGCLQHLLANPCAVQAHTRMSMNRHFETHII